MKQASNEVSKQAKTQASKQKGKQDKKSIVCGDIGGWNGVELAMFSPSNGIETNNIAAVNGYWAPEV